MATLDSAGLCDEWVSFWRKVEAKEISIDARNIGPYDVSMARDEPEIVWDFVQRVFALVAKKPEALTFSMLASQPMEDLLSLHGESFICRVEQLARSDETFRLLLKLMWRNGIASDIWARLELARGGQRA